MIKFAPTNAQVRRALQGSIEKWQKIVDRTGIDEGTDNCPLCQMFVNNDDNGCECTGCPVQVDTGRGGCNGSPYGDWCDAASFDYKWDKHNKSHQAKKAAIAMLDYLKSLDKKFFGA